MKLMNVMPPNRPTAQRALPAISAALFCLMLTLPAAAEDLTVTAEFRPSMLNPTHNAFVNTTPQSGYCRDNPTLCQPGDFTINTGIIATNRRLYGGADADDREKYFLAVDGRWQDVTVHSADGQSLNVKIRLFLIGLRWNTGSDGTGAGVYGAAVGGCRGRVGVGSGSRYAYAWTVADSLVRCYRTPKPTTDRPGLRLAFSIGYHLQTPDPLSAQSGTYEGTLSYTVGNHQQIDLGQADYTDDLLNLRLVLTVAHDFQVEFPPQPQAHLAPQGGWQQWTDYGKVPARLQQQVPFQLTSSGEFSMKLRCEYQAGAHCGIRNATTQTIVPLDVSATLPSMHRLGDAMPANGVPLVAEHSGQAAPRFAPRYYAPGSHSSLEMAVSGTPVKALLDEGAATWRGDVTVIFDANP